MVNYNNKDFNTMKQEALKEMGMYNNNQKKGSSMLDISGLLNNIGIGKLDNDKIIIILMIIILAREGADLKLLLALGYILM